VTAQPVISSLGRALSAGAQATAAGCKHQDQNQAQAKGSPHPFVTASGCAQVRPGGEVLWLRVDRTRIGRQAAARFLAWVGMQECP
jgi:hypothetical protein